MTKNSVSRTWFLRNHTSYDCNLCYTCAKWYCLQVFFHFFKALIFWVDNGVKERKMIQNDKKLCLLHSISQEPYIIWLSFMVQIVREHGRRARNGPKWQKIKSVSLPISGTVHHMIVIFGTHFGFLVQIFSFFKILIFGVFRGVKGHKIT